MTLAACLRIRLNLFLLSCCFSNLDFQVGLLLDLDLSRKPRAFILGASLPSPRNDKLPSWRFRRVPVSHGIPEAQGEGSPSQVQGPALSWGELTCGSECLAPNQGSGRTLCPLPRALPAAVSSLLLHPSWVLVACGLASISPSFWFSEPLARMPDPCAHTWRGSSGRVAWTSSLSPWLLSFFRREGAVSRPLA